MEVKPIQIHIYQDTKGKEPFTEWLTSDCDKTIRARIFSRLDRVEQGNLGDCKSLGKMEDTIILLLLGGTKSTQKKDIEKAKKYWEDFGRRDKK
jgi:putative component of toxin-antitoxin plasmid stabilization module